MTRRREMAFPRRRNVSPETRMWLELCRDKANGEWLTTYEKRMIERLREYERNRRIKAMIIRHRLKKWRFWNWRKS